MVLIKYDIRDGSVQQIYDSHLGEVKTITFFDNNRRFVSTGTDNHLRLFEWGIPVETKQIKDPSITCVIATLVNKDDDTYYAQCMDSVVKTFDVKSGFRYVRKKVYRGHGLAGYNCQIEFSPDEKFLLSGDSSGYVFIWDRKSHRFESKINAHDSPVISVAWNPYHDCLVATGDANGSIKFIG